MPGHRHYTLWFVNESLSGGQACLYHDAGNAGCNHADAQALAWMVAGANTTVQLRFDWDVTYSAVWTERAPAARSRQLWPAPARDGAAVTLERNRYGLVFEAAPERAARGHIAIATDSSVQPCVGAVVGIGMHGAATFALPLQPNTNTVFTPAGERELVYWISFGAYALEAGDPVQPAMLNPGARICFPDNVSTMTAVLSPQNLWSIRPGNPEGC